MKIWRSLLAIVLTVCCLIIGYGFYKWNRGDWFNAIFFTVGLLGIMMSVLRNSKKSDRSDDSNSRDLTQ